MNFMDFFNELEIKFYKEVTGDINSSADFAIDNIQGRKLEGLLTSVQFEKKHQQGDEAERRLSAYRRIGQLGLSEEQLKDLRTILKDAITSAVHSIFVTIDGGTALSTGGTALDLINVKTKESLTKGALHENFMLFDPENEK